MRVRAWRRSWRAGCVSFGFSAPFAGIRQAYGPILGFLSVHLEETRTLEAALLAVLDASNGEDLVDGAHRALAGPFPAAVVVDGVHIIEAARQRTAVERLTGARGDVPPTLGGPTGCILITDCHPDPTGGGVAELEGGVGAERGRGHEGTGQARGRAVALVEGDLDTPHSHHLRLRLLGIDQDDAEIIDVGVRRATHDETAGRLKETRRVIVVQIGLGVEGRSSQRPPIDKGAGRVARPALAAIDAIGIGGQRRYAREPVEYDGEGQSIFLRAAAAPPGVEHGNAELAAADDGHPAAGVLGRTRKLGVLLGHFAGFAGHRVAKGNDLVASLPGRT